MTTRPLSTFLARLIWLCMAPLLLLAVALAWDSLQTQEEKQLREGEILTKEFVASIDRRLRSRINALDMLANSPLANDPRHWKELYAVAESFKKSFGSNVIFANSDRQMLFNTRAPYGTKLPRLPDSKGKTAAPLVLETGQAQVGDIVIGPVVGVPLVAIAVPVLRGGKTTHLMLTTFEASNFQDLIDAMALPKGWALTLQDSTGAVIVRRAPPGFDGARDVADDHRFISRSQLSPWTVMLEIPRNSHHASLVRSLSYLAVAILIATLTGILGGVLASRRIVRQVRMLAVPQAQDASRIEIAEIASARKEQEAASAAEARSEMRFKRLFDEAPVALCYVDRDGVMKDRNARFDQLFGYDHDELRTLDDWWLLAYPDPVYRVGVLERWNAAIAQAAETGTDIEPIEYAVRCKNGERRFVLISGITIGEDYLATVYDMTERRLAEIALRESEERMRLFIEHAPASLAMFDRDMRYLAASHRWMDDYHLISHDIIGRSHYDIFPEITATWKNLHQRGLAGEALRNDEDRFVRSDGSVQWLRWEILPWRRTDGEIGGIVIFSEDITLYKQAEDEIRQLNTNLEKRVVERTAELTAANRELDSFAYAVSHDLRAPLRAMNGFSLALQQDFGNALPKDAMVYLDQISIASHKMGELIDGILALSRSTRGELRRDHIDLSAMSSQLLAELARAEPDRKIAWQVEPGLSAVGDARMIETALRNLLGNAWKYTAKTPAPAIRVHADELGGQPAFCITDNGAGFDMAHADQLFQPFRRLHRVDEFPGIGIGLATVQRIIKRHGGEIRADSRPGAGASFRFTLPAVIPQEGP